MRTVITSGVWVMTPQRRTPTAHAPMMTISPSKPMPTHRRRDGRLFGGPGFGADWSSEGIRGGHAPGTYGRGVSGGLAARLASRGFNWARPPFARRLFGFGF